ncbi:FecR domain-containing protein [Paraflavitalea sp. CAU 1676]|uniref:FecR family protein n=1 Tax=Paraflavitalea sp. CAU 1676 TaxID=3032598 RepID=UPI0023D9AD12|nr:FecR domain-containing protein [Paraflavitalea sp. CAU 1676]MDF2192298.1 FecR domain-containing protein [Paraflavitalea sp. CAU 1676]
MPRKSRRNKTPSDDQQWQQAWEQPDALDPAHKELLRHNIHQKLARSRQQKKQLFYIGLSAAAAILVAVFFKMPWSQQEPVQEAWTELHSNDSARQVTLQDGSVLWLAPRSTVRIHPDFRMARNTELTRGTVFFNIAKDSLHQFSISVNKHSVTVLGTQFTINKIDSQDIRLTVKEGKVSLKNNSGQLLVTTGMQVQTSGGRTGKVAMIDPLVADWWTRSEIRLYDISLETLIRCIESYYGVKLSTNHIDPKMKISLTWNLTVPLNDNLKVLNALTGFNIH